MQQRELTTRQAAAFLGISDASLKRLCDAGGLPCRREGKARRFALSDLIADLRTRDAAPTDLLSALEAGHLDACAALIAQQWSDGASFAHCFDTLLASSFSSPGVPRLMSRLQALAAPPARLLPAAIVGPESGQREASALSMACVVLRARGFQPLATPAQTSAGELASLALRASAAVIVLAAPLPDGDRLVEALGGTPLLFLDPAACRFVELDARLRTVAADYQTRTRSAGAR